jgi:plastocyanin
MRRSSIPVRIHAVALCAASLLAAACGGGETTPPAAEPLPPLPGESTVAGRVTVSGTVPEARLIKVSVSDPLCMVEGGAIRSEVIVVGPGNTLQNVFLHVKDGLGDRTFRAPTTPVVLDQRGCKYLPHVFGVQTGQPVEIVNSDGTLHNVHALAQANAEFNFSQQIKGMRTTRTFDKPEVMVPIKCEVHGWMRSYAGVVPHPFYAVSAADGAFAIKGLPAGTYTIEAWHEQLGTQTQMVTVDGKGGATADFVFGMKS